MPDNKVISASFIAQYINLIDTVTNSRERIYAGPEGTVCRNMKLSLDNKYLIFEEKGENSNSIKRMNISTREVETLYSDDNYHFTIINWLEGGDKVLVTMQNINNRKDKSLKATLCVLDCGTKEISVSGSVIDRPV